MGGYLKKGEVKKMKQDAYLKMTKKAMRLHDKAARKGIKFNMTRAIAAQKKMNFRDHMMSEYKPAGSRPRPLKRLINRVAGKLVRGAGGAVAFPITGPGTTRKKIGKKRGATGSW